MALVIAVIYASVGIVVWCLSRSWRGGRVRMVTAAFWPLAGLAAGLLLLTAFVLALTGYLNAWWLEHRHRLPRHLEPESSNAR